MRSGTGRIYFVKERKGKDPESNEPIPDWNFTRNPQISGSESYYMEWRENVQKHAEGSIITLDSLKGFVYFTVLISIIPTQ